MSFIYTYIIVMMKSGGSLEEGEVEGFKSW